MEYITPYNDLHTILIMNRPFIINKFCKLLTQSIENDSKGHVYGFNVDDHIKIGKTAHWDPNQRVKQWKASILFSVGTPFHNVLEKLVHLLFKFANVIHINESGKEEKERFKFEEKINVLTTVSTLNDILVSIHNRDYKKKVTNSVVNKVNYRKKININTATKQELMTIPYIKEARSSYIIEYRSIHKFRCIEDIMKVKYIKYAIFSKIKNYICI